VHHEHDGVRDWSVADKSSCHGDNQLTRLAELELAVESDKFDPVLLTDFLPLSENKL
jgi:hypothetical protein